MNKEKPLMKSILELGEQVAEANKKCNRMGEILKDMAKVMNEHSKDLTTLMDERKKKKEK